MCLAKCQQWIQKTSHMSRLIPIIFQLVKERSFFRLQNFSHHRLPLHCSSFDFPMGSNNLKQRLRFNCHFALLPFWTWLNIACFTFAHQVKLPLLRKVAFPVFCVFYIYIIDIWFPALSHHSTIKFRFHFDLFNSPLVLCVVLLSFFFQFSNICCCIDFTL